MSTIKFTRFAPGLYLDSTSTYVITRDIEATGNYHALYTIREFMKMGTLLDGVTRFPDYGSIICGEAYSLAEAKEKVLALLA